jgi:hypothetical protein
MQKELCMSTIIKNISHNSYTSYELCPVLMHHLGKTATYIVQQLHYWLLLENPSLGIAHDGKQWFYNSHEQWVGIFKKNNIYLSSSSVRRGLSFLENEGIVCACCFTKPGNNINSYTIDYNRLEDVVGSIDKTRLQRIPPAIEESLSSEQQTHFSENREEDFQVQCASPYPQNALVVSDHKPAQAAQMNTLKPVQPVQMSRPINRYISTKPFLKNLSCAQVGEPAPILMQTNQSDQPEIKKINIAQDMVRIWNEVIEHESAPALLTEKRSRYLTTAFNQFFNQDIEQWITFCSTIASSKFLMGETQKSNWRIDLDWALNFEKLQLIREKRRYTFGDRPVTHTSQVLNEKFDVTSAQTKCTLVPTETSGALSIRHRLQEALKRNYSDENNGLYSSWFKETYIEVDENKNNARKIVLYVKLAFIKEQIAIRFRDLCERLFDEIRVGFPEIKPLDIECSRPLGKGMSSNITYPIQSDCFEKTRIKLS